MIDFTYSTIPLHMMESLKRYIEQRIQPGHFLTAVLENNLKEAVGRADDVNIRLLPEYIAYPYNEAPGLCWGSPERVRTWLKARGESQ